MRPESPRIALAADLRELALITWPIRWKELAWKRIEVVDQIRAFASPMRFTTVIQKSVRLQQPGFSQCTSTWLDRTQRVTSKRRGKSSRTSRGCHPYDHSGVSDGMPP